ncbi:Zinc finger, nanos-type domain-containing protein [Strongyloides ratti]|uniref:Zinc finger, nanos-type domain-containing protein n=1 Tax=Strongyloides ratti TaxID=34506 RepID=A0A090KZK1_STRRB|nr:Zinc finger, nanos-type domain-containing protein [Strongyloides ratti]CEF61272.1 Zinc finger, nanos-type domain-containing protein [Strongyloides ratti]
MYSYEYDLKPLDFCDTSFSLKNSLKKYETSECERLIQASFHASFKDDDVLPSSFDSVFDLSIFSESQSQSVSKYSSYSDLNSKQLFSSDYVDFNDKSSFQLNFNDLLIGEECNNEMISKISNNISGVAPTISNGNLIGNQAFGACWHPLLSSNMLDQGDNLSYLKMKSSTTRDPFTSMLSKPMKQHNSHDNGQNSNAKNQSATKSSKQNLHCSFCFNNERVRCERQKIEFNASNPKGLWNKHNNKNDKGIVTCPFLRKLVCPSCGATGDFAHTRRHCPLNNSIYK